MTGAVPDAAAAPARPKEDPETLVLRGRPRPAVRFRRGLIIGITGAVAASLVSLAWLALEPPSFRKAAGGTEAAKRAQGGPGDALANVPSSYGDVPRLGPPLPGDLGRPILEHRRSVGEAPLETGAAAEAERARSAAEAERQRLLAERQSARGSAVIVRLRSSSPRAPAAEPPGPPPPSESALPGDGGVARAAGLPAAEQHKLDFVKSANGDINPHGLRAPPSPWTLTAGTVIPASLVTGLNSDLPGMVLAQVTENVRDSATGRAILIPQGARLIGNYDSVVAFGQRRALLVWTRLMLPDGSSVQLESMPATDTAGYAGVADRVDFHTWQLLKGIGLSTLLGVGTELSLGSGEGDLVRAIRESAQQSAVQAGGQITARNLEIQPTITVRPGWPLRAIVHKDLVLQPWRG